MTVLKLVKTVEVLLLLKFVFAYGSVENFVPLVLGVFAGRENLDAIVEILQTNERDWSEESLKLSE